LPERRLTVRFRARALFGLLAGRRFRWREQPLQKTERRAGQTGDAAPDDEERLAESSLDPNGSVSHKLIQARDGIPQTLQNCDHATALADGIETHDRVAVLLGYANV
jgi:hypothetical protein